MFNWFNNMFGGGSSAQQQTAVDAATEAPATGPNGLDMRTNWMGMQVETPTMNTGGFSGKGFAGNAGAVLGGVQALGNLWNSYQQNKLAKDQFEFTKDSYNTNLRNQTQTYNTALEDRIRARHHMEGKGEGQTQKYLDKNKL